MTQGFVSEIYSTVQGEGLYLGEKQIFIRLAGCPLRCQWCDTPGSLTASGHPLMSVTQVMGKVRKAGGRSVKTVSITGGEPLAQVEFLSEILKVLKKGRWKTYLETAGVHPRALARVIRYCDVVSMDIKLPSAVGRPYWKEHAEFLRIAGKKAFVKIVVTRGSKETELKKSFNLVAARSRKTPVILQPVTLRNRIYPPSPDQLSRWLALAKKSLSDVRIIPQMHPIWGIR